MKDEIELTQEQIYDMLRNGYSLRLVNRDADREFRRQGNVSYTVPVIRSLGDDGAFTVQIRCGLGDTYDFKVFGNRLYSDVPETALLAHLPEVVSEWQERRACMIAEMRERGLFLPSSNVTCSLFQFKGVHLPLMAVHMFLQEWSDMIRLCLSPLSDIEPSGDGDVRERINQIKEATR